MILTFRPIKVWPEDWDSADAERPGSPFDSTYSATLDLLDRELTHLKASNVILQVDASEGDVRLDGQLRADAKVNHPGVILSFDTPTWGTLTYACDAFTRRGWRNDSPSWQQNLRAIALGLESLRRVERYGIAGRGQQYAGYRELGTGLAMGPMTRDQAAAFLVEHGEVDNADEPGDPDCLLDPSDPLRDEIVDGYYRRAAKRLHPDVGGDPDLFKQLGEARDLLR